MKPATFSAIETLESRIAPASIVDVIVKGGVLTLKSLSTDDGDEKLTISGSSTTGEFLVDPDPGTQLRFEGTILADGASQLVTGVTKGASISLGAGSDELTLSDFLTASAVKIDLGEGTNKLTATNFTTGPLTFKSGSGGDTVTITTMNVIGSATFDLGSGTNSGALNSLGTSGDFTLKTGAGNDTFGGVGDGLAIGGKLTLQLGDGTNTVVINAPLFVSKDASITTGKNNDTLALNCLGDLVIGGSLTVSSGKGSDILGLNLSGSLQVAKNLTLTSQGQAVAGDDVDQDITVARGFHVGGKLSFVSGTSDSLDQSIFVTNRSLVTGGAISFSGTAKSANQSIVVDKALTVGGALNLAVKSVTGGATYTQSVTNNPDNGVSDSTVQGAMTLTGGTNVTLGVRGDLVGAVKITTAPGLAATVTLGKSLAGFEGAMLGPLAIKIDAKAPSSDIKIDQLSLAGAVSINGGNGADTVAIRDVSALAAVAIKTNAGGDTINLDFDSTLASVSGYLGTLLIKPGTGADLVHIGGSTANEAVVLLGQVTFDLTPVELGDLVQAGPQATFLTLPKTLS